MLPAKEAVMVASQVARGLDRLNTTPTSFRTARAARRKWQTSNNGDQAAGRPWSWEADRPKEEMDMVVMIAVECVTQSKSTVILLVTMTTHPVVYH